MNHQVVILLILLSTLILAKIGSQCRSATDADSFHIENKQVDLSKVICGIFSVVGGGELIAVAALSYSFGIWSALLFGGFALGALLFIPLIKSVRKFNHEKENRALDVYSIPDYAYVYCGRPVSFLMTVYTVLALGSLLLIQLSLGGQMIEILTGLPAWYAVVLISATVGYYVYRGGFKGILVTDVIQIGSLFLVFTILTFALDTPGVTTQKIVHHSKLPDPATLAVLIVGGICWVLGGPDIWQRILAAKSDRVATTALGFNSLFLCLFGVILAILGTKLALVMPDVAPEVSFFSMLDTLPFGLKCLTAIGLVAALLSTSDTELHAISTLVNKEISRGSSTGIDTNKTKILILVVSVVSAGLAIAISDYLLDLYFVLLNVFMIMGAGVLPIILNRGSRTRVLFGLIGGGATLCALVFHGLHIEGAYSLLVTLPPLIFGFTSSRSKALGWIRPLPTHPLESSAVQGAV